MMTAEERRIDFYGDGDSRAYDHDELYIMKEYAKDYHETEVNKLKQADVSGSLPTKEMVINVARIKSKETTDDATLQKLSMYDFIQGAEWMRERILDEEAKANLR